MSQKVGGNACLQSRWPLQRQAGLLESFKKAADQSPKGGEYKFWQDGSHPIELYTAKFTVEKLNYIHYNPVEEMPACPAGRLVTQPWEYMFSSARNYADMDSILDVIIIS